MRSLRLFTVLGCLALAVIVDAQEPAKPKPTVIGVRVADADEAMRKAFAEKFPDKLPSPTKGLPAATAAHFDWTDIHKNVNVHSQGSFSTCWSHAAIGALEWSWLNRNGKSVILSVQPILDRTQKTGGGSQPMVMRTLLEHGTAEATAYPYLGEPGPLKANVPTKFRIITYGKIADAAKDTAAVKHALLAHGPVVTSVLATAAFHKHKGGVFDEHRKPKEGEAKTNHAILIVGWDDKRGKGCWKIQNSWGLKWGEKGFAWIEYGSNQVGTDSWWLTAQSTQYVLPAEVHRTLSPEADPFTEWPGAKKLEAHYPVITAAEAPKQTPNKKYCLEMKVHGVRKTAKYVILDTGDPKAPESFAVYLSSELVKKMTDDGIVDFPTYFADKRLRITAEIRELPTTQRLIMLVTDRSQIVEEKK
jgi:C1A family cysteine protease